MSQHHPAPCLGMYSTSTMIFRLDIRFSSSYPQLLLLLFIHPQVSPFERQGSCLQHIPFSRQCENVWNGKRERKMRSQIYMVRKREGLDLKVRCSTSATNFTHDFGESHNLGCLETLSVKCDRHASFMKHSVGKDHSCEGFRCWYGIDGVDEIHVVRVPLLSGVRALYSKPLGGRRKTAGRSSVLL